MCRLDVYWDDAILSVIQHKGVGYEVIMTGAETRHFSFEGLDNEFNEWSDSISSGIEVTTLTPEESLQDLLIIEAMCNTKLNKF